MDDVLQDFFVAHRSHTQPHTEHVRFFFNHLQTFALRGGKRLRSLLARLAYTGLGGKNLNLGNLIAVELLHTYFLIHDDIMDQDKIRYGGPTIWAAYNETLKTTIKSPAYRRHFSQGIAILAGDLINALVSSTILEAHLPLTTQRRLLELLFHCQRDTLFGQLLDAYSSITLPTPEEVLEVYRLKTSIYSIAVPLQFGAILAGHDDSKLHARLQAFAEPLGIAFQLSDDYLGIFGNPDTTGKSDATDLLQQKKTYLILETRSLLSDGDRQNFDAMFFKEKPSPEELARLKDFVHSSGALAQVHKLIDDSIAKAKESLSLLPLTDDAKIILNQFADFVVKREH